jgi:hypothetical protein
VRGVGLGHAEIGRDDDGHVNPMQDCSQRLLSTGGESRGQGQEHRAVPLSRKLETPKR